MFTFKTEIVIPESAVNVIGLQVKKTFLELLPQDTPESLIYEYAMLLNQAIGKCVGSPLRSEGWSLDAEAVFKIAKHLRDRKRIDAIRTFREYTGSGLKEGKNFIDNFGTGSDASKLFVDTMLV